MTPATTTEPIPIFPELAGTRRFSRDEYRRMIEAGILGVDERVELRDGYVLYQSESDLPSDDGPFPQWRWLRRFTSAEYHQMLDLGIIDREEKLELLDGYVVLKMSQNPPHRSALTRFTYRLPPRLPAGWLIMTNCPISLGDFDPEPDGVIVRGDVSDYDNREPTEADFGIAVEVSDSTLDMDRTGKFRLYARFGIPVYWIINVVDRQIEVYTNPDATANPPAYAARLDYKPGDTVPIMLDGVAVGTIPVVDLIA
jgi:Uma2 family endonuclease